MEADLLRGKSSLHIYRSDVERLRRQVTTSVFAPMIVAGILIGALWLPMDWSLAVLDDRAAARQFLEPFWQVEATVVALSFAVIVFSFEAFGGRARSAEFTLREFARESNLLAVFWIGISGVVAVGVVLLSGGEGAPGGWAATWSVALGVIALVAISWLVYRSLDLMDPDGFLNRQLKRIRDAIRADTEIRVLQHLAGRALNTWSSANNVELETFLAKGAGPSETDVLTTTAGQVSDIRLRRLERILRKDGLDKSVAKLRLQATLGTRVGTRTRLMVVPKALDDSAVRRYRRCIKVRSSRD